MYMALVVPWLTTRGPRLTTFALTYCYLLLFKFNSMQKLIEYILNFFRSILDILGCGFPVFGSKVHLRKLKVEQFALAFYNGISSDGEVS